MADELVGRGIIEIVGDATQFSAAMAEVRQAAGLAETAVVKSAGAIGESMQQAESKAGEATGKIDGVTKRYIASVEREIATLSLSKDAYRAWEAQVKGVPESVYTPFIAKLNEAREASQRFSEDATFNKKLADAAQLVKATEYVRFWEDALQKAEMQERELAATNAFNQKAADAAKLVKASEYVRFWEDALEKAEQQEKQFAAQNAFVASLERESAAIGKTRADLLELQAAKLGVSKQAEPFIARLRESENALRRGSIEFDEYGRSAKQTTAALRQVPAQLTDIVVSLQGGQAPLTVLLQQGGQLKDVFGGIRPAAAALGGELLNLARNPLVLAGTALATLAFGYFKGSQEGDKFRQSLALTGNQIGLTGNQLQQYAAAVDQVAGTQSQASAIIAKFVSTNQVSAQSIQTVTAATIRSQELLGTTVEDTVAKFAELGKDPVQASIKLNQETGFLTFALFEQIKALQAQGRATEAADLAQRAFADTLNQRTGQIEANLGSIERGWLAIKRAVREAGDAILSIGRIQPPGSSITEDQVIGQARRVNPFITDEQLAGIRERFRQDRESLRTLESRNALRASEAGIQAKINEGAIGASQAIDARATRALTKQQQLNKELRAYRNELEAIRLANPNDARLLPQNVSIIEANIRDQFRERGGGRRAAAITDDAATRRLQQLRETEAALRLELSTSEKLVGAQRDLAEFNQLIADLKEKRVLTADQKSLLAAQESIRAQLQKNVGLQQEIKLRDDAAKREQEAVERLQRLRERGAQTELAVAEAARVRREQADDRLGVFGQGQRAREELAAQVAIQRQFQRFQDQLRNATTPDLLGSDEFNKRRESINEGLNQALADNQSYYDRLRVLQSDWQNGAQESLRNYVDGAANIAEKLENVFTKAFKGAEDALVQFVRTGKLDFKSLADSIVTDLIRIAVQQQITGPLAAALSGGISSGTGAGGFLGTALSALFGARAIGGPVSPNRAYRVNENGPEMLNMQGRQYLMTGNNMGIVESTPAVGARQMNVTNQFYISGPVDRRTQSQIAAEAGRGVQRALVRNT